MLSPSSGRPEFPFDEQKEEDACRFSLALKVWITSVVEHTHTHTHTQSDTHRGYHAQPLHGTLDLDLHVFINIACRFPLTFPVRVELFSD